MKKQSNLISGFKRAAIMVIAIIFLMPICAPGANAANWYQGSSGRWLFRKMITIDHTKVPNTDQSNYPMLFSRTDVSFKDTSNGGHVAQSNGNDFLFTASDGVTKLSHEINVYTPSTGELVAWVKIPTLTTATDTVIYLYYGNASAANQQDVANTWVNFAAVYHMNQSGTSATDSTSNANNAVYAGNLPNVVTGKIGNAQSLNGSTGRAEAPNSTSLSLSSTVSINAWVNPTALVNYGRIAAKSTATNASPWTEYGLLFDNASHLRAEIATGTTQHALNGTTAIPTGTWSFASSAYDGSSLKLYLNGAQQGSLSFTGSIATNTMPLSIGRSGYSADYFNGILDEIWVSNVARSADWFATLYNNQNSPSTFYSVNMEEWDYSLFFMFFF